MKTKSDPVYDDQDYLPLSGLQHMAFCERQAALIHVERLWAENLFTAQGRVMHEKVHAQGHESRGDVRIEYSLLLCSPRLGLWGVADMVEFHRPEDGKGPWRPYPVEYKRGRPKAERCDEVQLCAQAMCLEDMLDCRIKEGALFYGKTRKRTLVIFDRDLRELTGGVAERFHALIDSGKTPPPVFGEQCETCSLKGLCAPKTCGRKKSVGKYLKRMTGEP